MKYRLERCASRYDLPDGAQQYRLDRRANRFLGWSNIDGFYAHTIEDAKEKAKRILAKFRDAEVVAEWEA